MENITDKEILLNLLKENKIDEFNNARAYSNEILLNLTELDFSSMKLTNVNLSKTDLSSSDFNEAELLNIDFSESDLSSSNFTHSKITESNFTEGILEGAILNHAVIKKCEFAATDLNGAHFCETNLSNSDLSTSENIQQSIHNSETVWPTAENLPDDFEPETDEKSIAELEDDDPPMEDQYSY